MDNKLELLKKESGLPVLADTPRYVNRVPVPSETSDVEYIVSQRRGDTKVICSCMGFIRHGYCKHVRALEPLYQKVGLLK